MTTTLSHFHCWCPFCFSPITGQLTAEDGVIYHVWRVALVCVFISSTLGSADIYHTVWMWQCSKKTKQKKNKKSRKLVQSSWITNVLLCLMSISGKRSTAACKWVQCVKSYYLIHSMSSVVFEDRSVSRRRNVDESKE